MTRSFLAALLCPSCGKQFGVQHIVAEDSERILTGIIACGCGEFPVLEGILIHKCDGKTRSVLQLIRTGRTFDALRVSLDYAHAFNRLLLASANGAPLPYTFWRFVLRLFAWNWTGRISLYSTLDVASKLGIDRFWTTYLQHRFSATSYWCTLPFVQQVPATANRVIDIGCGFGLFSWALSKRVAEQNILCQNLHFAGLYIARKYFVPNANFLCSDFGVAQPLHDGHCDVVFSCDALAYVEDKERAVEETCRLLNDDGLLVLTHNHVPGYFDYASQGYRGDFLSPEEAEEKFGRRGVRVRWYDEGEVCDEVFPGSVRMQ